MKTNWSEIDNKDTLYHYTKIGTAVEHILYEKRLRFSTGINTNDPREYQSMDLEPTLEGDCAQDTYSQNWKEAEKSLAETKDCYKYLCFCLNETFPGYALPRMWAQYGENFYGVCVAFSVQSLKEWLRDKGTVYADKISYPKNLEYKDLSLSTVDAKEFIGKNKGDWADRYIKSHVDSLFFLKHLNYKSENEYRIVVHDPKGCLEYVDVSGCIKAVILGDRTKAVYHEIVKRLCRKMNADCKQAVWQKGRFDLIDV